MAPFLGNWSDGLSSEKDSPPASSAAASASSSMPIAVIGMGFRGPGEATSVDNFYRLIQERKDTWSRVPPAKWNADAFYHPDPSHAGTSHVRGGHYLKGDPSKFDARFFHMTPQEAEALDPQQRMLLETCYEALENAGIPLHKAQGSKTSVFVGTFATDYTELLYGDTENMPTFQATSSGNSRAIISNRLSYFFDFRGPSVTVDTACSASMVAFHLACQSLRSGDAEQAVVGGCSLILSPHSQISMSAMGFLSPDGRCYTFSDQANGYGRSEGAGCLILKPFAAAVRDGDPIRAVVRGTSSNQDGKTPGISFPSQDAQEQLILSDFASCGIDPVDVGYHELHGTGTAAGDPIEAVAIYNTMSKNRDPTMPLRIGSVKTNIGHMEAASGIASLIKCVRMLEDETILPSINFERANPRIPLEDWKLQFCTQGEPWGQQPKRLSVSGFGYGGTNAHAILEQAQYYINSFGIGGILAPRPDIPVDSCRRIFPLSAAGSASLKDKVLRIRDYLQRKDSEPVSESFWSDLLHTLQSRQSRLSHNIAVQADSLLGLVKALEDVDVPTQPTPTTPSLGFVFTGQGAQWAGMGRELLDAFPVYRHTLNVISALIKRLGADWDVVEELGRDSATSRINEALFSQPLCTAVQIALVELLVSFGVRPIAVTGHSSGEIAAAYTAGALSLPDAVSAAYFRGIAAAKMASAPMKGGMMAVGLSSAAVQPLLHNLGRGKVVVACENSPVSTTCSGDLDGIEELGALLEAQGTFARQLAVDVAYHSHHMEYIGQDYSANIPKLSPNLTKSCKFFSSVTGAEAEPSVLGPDYWVENMLGRVRFSESFHQMCLFAKQQGGSSHTNPQQLDIVVELGPHSALSGPIGQIIKLSAGLDTAKTRYMSALIRKRSATESVAELMAQLYSAGVAIDVQAFNQINKTKQRPTPLVDLPLYPWDHKTTYWAESRLSRSSRQRKAPRRDILGAQDYNFSSEEPRWRNIIRIAELPWVQDHKVQSNVIWPGAGFLAMAIQAMEAQMQQRGADVESFVLRDVSIMQALIIPQDTAKAETMVCLRRQAEGTRLASDVWYEFSVYSILDDSSWICHCRGLIQALGAAAGNSVDPGAANSTALRQQRKIASISSSAADAASLDVSTFYRTLQSIGLEYGPSFSNIQSLKASKSGSSYGTLQIPNTSALMTMGHEDPVVIHPATLDSSFHGIFAALGSSTGKTTPMVPSFIRKITVSNSSALSKSGAGLNFYTSIDKHDHRTVESTVLLTAAADSSPGSAVLVDISGLVLTELPSDSHELGNTSNDGKLVYRHIWVSHPDFTMGDAHGQDQPDRTTADASCYEALSRAFAETLNSPEQATPYLTALNSYLDMASTQNQVQENSEPIKSMVLKKLLAALPGILSGKVDAVLLLKTILEDTAEDDWEEILPSISALEEISQRCLLNPNLRILEVGSCAGRTATALLHALSRRTEMASPLLGAYHIHSEKEDLIQGLGDLFESYKGLITRYAVDAAVPGAKYDLVVVSGQTDMNSARLSELLAPTGSILHQDYERPRLAETLVMGSLPGWLPFSKDYETTNGLFSHDELQQARIKSGSLHNQASLCYLVVNDLEDGLAKEISRQLSTTSCSTEIVLLGHALPKDANCIVLCDLGNTSVLAAPTSQAFDAVKTILLRTGLALWVTSGAGEGNPGSNLASGLIRSARTENGGGTLAHLDMQQDYQQKSLSLPRALAASTILRVFALLQRTPGESVTGDVDFEFRERNGTVQVPRLVPDQSSNKLLQGIAQGSVTTEEDFDSTQKALRLEVSTPGTLDAVQYVEDESARDELAADQVEIEVQASGVNFRDVMMCMGQIAVEELGAECSGVIKSVGTNVTDFQAGDRVACCHLGSFANRIRTKAAVVQKVPDSMTLATAASLPVVYCTAYYALYTVGHLAQGETILIHAASGGLGQAAIELALAAGATVYVTVGSNEKKQFLMQHYGIPEKHILYSRDYTFANRIMELTNDKGVDVVLNSVAGEGLRVTWNCIGAFGRFLEVGKRDFFVNSFLEMAPFAKNVTFACIDLIGLLREKPTLAGAVWEKAMKMLSTGQVRPPSPLSVYPFQKVTDAFRTMQLSKHIGKLVAVRSPETKVKAVSSPDQGSHFVENASYVLVGGMGGIGRKIAQWMIESGARHLILLSRSGAASSSAKEAVAAFANAGAQVYDGKCDITDKDALAKVISECRTCMPPIRGVIQSAMVLRDGMLDGMSLDDYESVLQPKVTGTWNLHTAIQEPLDFFIMLSSISGIIGNSSQANYAAANTFLDAFASYRRSQGLAATSINLGVIADAGYVAENSSVAAAMRRQGFQAMPIKTLCSLLGHAVSQSTNPAASEQLTTGISSWTSESCPPGFNSALFALVRRDIDARDSGAQAAGASTQKTMRDTLKQAASIEEAASEICNALVEKVAALSMGNVSDIDQGKPLSDYGIDSLVAVEMRNWIFKEMDVRVPILDLLAKGTTFVSLGSKIARECRLVSCS